MQPVSLNLPASYSVHSIRGEQERMPRREREFAENYEQRQENFKKAYANAVLMANLKDEQLLSIAKRDAHRDDKYKFNTYAAALVGVPVVDTFLNGAFTDAPKLSGKLGVMGRTALGWGGVFALAGLYNGAVNKVSAVSPTMKSFQERHPVIASLLSLAGFAAVLIGAHKGVGKLAEYLPKKFPGVAEDLAKMSATVAEKINNSKINDKIVQPLKQKVLAFAEKYPKTASTTVSALKLSVPVMVLGTLFKSFTEKAEKAEQVKDTYNKLAQIRDLNRANVEAVNLRLATEPLALAVNQAVADVQDEIDSENSEDSDDLEASHLDTLA